MDCRSRGMALATIDSEGEHELALRKLVNEYFDFNAPSWSNLKFWVGYKEMGGSLVAVDGGLTSYIENRLGTSGSGTCVHGDKEFGELAPLPNSLETFAYGLCDQKLPYACEESPCSICDTCVESIRTGFTENHEFGDDQASALAEWSAYCGGQNEYTDAQCEEALIAISGSVKVAKRPAALCGLVGKCYFDDDCSIQVGGPVDVEDIAFCTETGTAAGAVVGTTNYADSLNDTASGMGDCLTSSDCNATSFCDFSKDYGSASACDAETGVDTTKAKGMCLPKCALPAIQAEKERRNELFSDKYVCNSTASKADCPTGYECREALDACQTGFVCDYNDNNEPYLVGDSCPGMCFRTSLEIVNATFSNDADAIMVDLNEMAQAFSAPCQNVFDSATMALLGSAACSVKEEDRKILRIRLSGDASINVGDTLTLAGTQVQLVGYTSPDTSFNGAATVGKCAMCTPPTVQLIGPATIRQPCNGSDIGYATVFIGSSSSSAPSGRELKSRTWGLDTESPGCAASSVLLATVEEASAQSREVLMLDNSILSEIDDDQGPVTYCFTLEVESFLNVTSSPGTHKLTIQNAASATPSVSVMIPGSTTISSGLTLSGSVDTASVCSTSEVAEYKWECEAPCPLLTNATFTTSIVRDISFSDLYSAKVGAGDAYNFQMTARLRNVDTDVVTATASSASQRVTFEGDPLIASFTKDSASGEYKRRGQEPEMIALIASASRDPSDPDNIVQPMRYTFSCQRPDGISSCFDTADGSFYTGSVDGAEWMLNLAKFANDGDGDADAFILRVDVGKGSDRIATATRPIRLLPEDADPYVRARVDQFCGGSCPAVSPSSEPLSFSVAILNEGDLSGSVDQANFSWFVNGKAVVRESMLGTSGDDPIPSSITLRPISDANSILPRSGDINVTCSITVGDATGSAEMAVTLEGPPMCVEPEGRCINIVPRGAQAQANGIPTQTFPDVTFRVEARGFSGSNDLNYEFGFVQDNNETQVARAAGSTPSAELGTQRGNGTYIVYVQAIDSRNGGRSNLVAAQISLAPAEDVSAAADAGAEELDFQVLQNTGWSAAVHYGLQMANAFKNAKTSNGSGRRLLSSHDDPTQLKTTEGLKATLDTLDSQRASDAISALASIFETTPSDTDQAKFLAQVVQNAMRILDSQEAGGIGTTTVRKALDRLGVATRLLTEQCTGGCFDSSDDHWEIVMMVENTLKFAREVMRRTAPSGVTATAVSTSFAQAVSRNTLQATSTASVALDVENGNDKRARARFANDASASEFLSYCAAADANCNQERLTLYLSYVTNPDTYTTSVAGFPGSIIDSHYVGASTQPAAISGVLEIQLDFKDDGDLICQTDDECHMELDIPISTDSMPMLDGKSAACVRITQPSEGTNQFTTEVVFTSVEISSATQTLPCRVSSLGRYMIMSYTSAVPSPLTPGEEEPSLSPSPPPANPPPPDQAVGDPTFTAPSPSPFQAPVPDTECTGNPNKAITISVTFNLDQEGFSATNIRDLTERLHTNIGRFLEFVDGLRCPVKLAHSGSPGGGARRLMASTWDVEVDLGESTPAATVRRSRRALADTIKEEGFQERFIGDFEAAGGTVAVNEAIVTSDPNSFAGCSTDDPDRQVTASLLLNSEQGNLEQLLNTSQVSALELEAAAQLENQLQTKISNSEVVLGDCPVKVTLNDVRSILTVNTDGDASVSEVQSAYDAMIAAEFDAITLDGIDFQVTVEFDHLPSAFTGSASAVAVTTCSMILTVLAMIIASRNFF